MKQFTGLLITRDTDGNLKFIVKTIDDNLESLQRVIKANTIDIAVRKINHQNYNFVIDGNGKLLKKDITAVSFYENIAGDIFIVKTDKCGNLASLNEKDLRRIKESTVFLPTVNGERQFLLYFFR